MCQQEPPPTPPIIIEKDTALLRLQDNTDTVEDTIQIIEDSVSPVLSDTQKIREMDPNEGKYKLTVSEKPKKETPFIDSLYVYADPWGGRHFDSVRVSLFCRESCLVLYGFDDSLKLSSYENPFTITRNTRLWIAGINEKGEQSVPVKIPYTIEKESGNCPQNMLPAQGQVCMDIYEWPNRKGELPQAYVSQQEAADSCMSRGKRLCRVEEWQGACEGLHKSSYPYGDTYNENHCAAKERAAKRSGRYPACRSYFGQYDLTGNLWEWTQSPAAQREGFYMVVGGNWEGANQATCTETKYSFYPQNRYLFVGFRCCLDPQ